MATWEEIRRRRVIDNLNPKILQHNETVLDGAILGDMIKVSRKGYSHWGIYSGHGKMIHKTGAEGMMASQSRHICSCSGERYDKSIVREEKVLLVAENSKIEIDNYLDGKKVPFFKQKIVQNARGKIGETSYNLMSENCQHFATECRYGEPHSQQVSNAKKVTAAIGGGILLAGLIGAAAYAVSKMTEKDEEEEYEEA